MSETAFETNGSSNSTSNSKVAAKLSFLQSAPTTSCYKCKKRVYDMEKIAIEQELIFHKNCFRCTHCQGILTVRNYTIADGKPFCKQHYISQFKEGGGKYNFAGQQTTPTRWNKDVVHVAGVSSTSSTTSETPRPLKSWTAMQTGSEQRSRDNTGPPPMVDMCTSPTTSDTRSPTGVPVVANIRSMFEKPHSGTETNSTTEERTGQTHHYVEGEKSVISMMKNQSSVKSRMAKFSGAASASENHSADNAGVRESYSPTRDHKQIRSDNYDDSAPSVPASHAPTTVPQRSYEDLTYDEHAEYQQGRFHNQRDTDDEEYVEPQHQRGDEDEEEYEQDGVLQQQHQGRDYDEQEYEQGGAMQYQEQQQQPESDDDEEDREQRRRLEERQHEYDRYREGAVQEVPSDDDENCQHNDEDDEQQNGYGEVYTNQSQRNTSANAYENVQYASQYDSEQQ